MENKKKIVIVSIIIVALVGGLLGIFLPPLFRNGGVPPEDDPPLIHAPTSSLVFATQDTTINVDVDDDNGVSSVVLSYAINSISAWHNITMTGLGSTNWSGSGIIPAQDIETTIYYQIYARDSAGYWSLNNNSGNFYELYTGSRKAIIVGSANDFYGSEEEEFNGGINSNFDAGLGDWEFSVVEGNVGHDPSIGNDTPGFVYFNSSTPEINATMTYPWTDYYPLSVNAFYNLSAWVRASSLVNGTGIRIGLQWLNSTNNVVKMDWSENVSDTTDWTLLNIMGLSLNDSETEITQMKIVVEASGNMAINERLDLDDVSIDRKIAVNVTDPNDPGPDPDPARIDSDGFPAQALQVYWILKNHSYTDENIFFMLYHKNDPVIDINALDLYSNDLLGAQIDVEDDDVNASRYKDELDVSKTGSFASDIQYNDQLIIYIVDHGSNSVNATNNATFHFEADNSHIEEHEFVSLVSQLDCWRMLINIDCCYSGNFLNENSSIGASWYDFDNAIMITASSNVFSWYWINNQNPDGFAGSWFFHIFWDAMDQGMTISNAFQFAKNWIPGTPKGQPLGIIQMPLIQDNLGIQHSWSFSSFSKL